MHHPRIAIYSIPLQHAASAMASLSTHVTARRIIGALLLAAALIGAKRLEAAPRSVPSQPLRITVSLADLDLTLTADRQRASQRVAAAARHLCWRLGDTRKVDATESFAACVGDATAAAQRQLALLAARN
jgi:UrcA family protein